MSEDYTASDVYQIQKTIDESDPFLVEAMIGKSKEELVEQIEKLYREYTRISPNNQGLKRKYKKIIDTVEAIYQSKCINDGDSRGGVIVG